MVDRIDVCNFITFISFCDKVKYVTLLQKRPHCNSNQHNLTNLFCRISQTLPLVSQIYPRDEPGTVWNSVQNGLVLARNGDECGSLAASIDCQYFDLMNNIVAIIEEHFNSVDVNNKDYNSMDRTKTERS